MSIDTEFFGGQPPRWVSGTNYPFAFVALSTISPHCYERIVAGAGTTDPSADPTNWRRLGPGSIKSIQRVLINLVGTSVTATVSPVDVNKSELTLLGFTSNVGATNPLTGSDAASIDLTSSTTITATRVTSAASTLNINAQLVEKW